jgi:hypothetical protein
VLSWSECSRRRRGRSSDDDDGNEARIERQLDVGLRGRCRVYTWRLLGAGELPIFVTDEGEQGTMTGGTVGLCAEDETVTDELDDGRTPSVGSWQIKGRR